MLFILALAMMVCLILGYLLPPGRGHSDELALTGWEWSIGITCLIASLLVLAGRNNPNPNMLRRDIVVIVGLGWIITCLVTSLPYMFCEPKLSFPQSFFEAASGLTTTGASVFDDLASLPETIIFWRSLTQWIGGMGILAMFVFVSTQSGVSRKGLHRTEASMRSNAEIGTTMRETAKLLWFYYIILTVLCAVGLWMMDLTLFQAINYSMTTVSTGGFGTESGSVSDFGTPARLWITLFMFVCGISFPLQIVLLKRKNKSHQNEEAWYFTGFILISFLFVLGMRYGLMENTGILSELVTDTLFNIVSVATSTGFVVGDYEGWPSLSKGIIVFLMVVGGCAGSTAGGLKVGRVILWFKIIGGEIHKVFRPNLVISYKLNGRKFPLENLGQLQLIFTSSIICMALGSFLLCAFELDKSVVGCVSAVISSVSNFGPAFGEYGPTHNFADTSESGMILLSILMILGRLEYTAILVLLSRHLWKRF